jgi:hypothetical protein
MQYMAMIEADTFDPRTLDFIMDVEQQMRRLLPTPDDFKYIHGRLLHSPACPRLKATRLALGEAFLDNGMWPIKNYFTTGRNGK